MRAGEARRHARADGAAHARSSRWPRPAPRAGRRPAPRRPSRAADARTCRQAGRRLAPKRASARSNKRLQASAVSGVFSDGFQTHGIAADQRQRRVPRPHRDREVEGRDDADHAQRVPGLHHAVAGALGGDGQAVELARQADGEVADVDHLLHFAQAFAGDLAGLDRHQPAQRRLVRAQLLAEQPHQFAAARRRHRAPGRERPRGRRRRACATSAGGVSTTWPMASPLIGERTASVPPRQAASGTPS